MRWLIWLYSYSECLKVGSRIATLKYCFPDNSQMAHGIYIDVFLMKHQKHQLVKTILYSHEVYIAITNTYY